MPASDIPFGSEFSPAVIENNLPLLLGMVEHYLPDRRGLQQAIDERFFQHQNRFDEKKSLGDNTLLSMQAYGLLSLTPDAYQFTDLGRNLLSLCSTPDEMYRAFAQHVLLYCKGLTVVDCIRDLMASDETLTKFTIARELRRRGFHVPENGKHLNNLRQWLELFGVVNPTKAKGGPQLWEPDENGIQTVLGLGVQELDTLSDLTSEQRDFARALALLDKDNLPSNQVREHATMLYGTVFPEGGLPQSVLHKLQDVGLITWTKTTGNQGAKPHLVSPTDLLRNTFLIPALESVQTAIGANYKKLVRMRLEDILRDLKSPNTGTKGIALEALAFYLTRLLDLTFVKWRYRGKDRGGAEVDILVEGSRLIFSRWQIQCKNTAKANVDDLAKEVGVATAMRTNVVVFVCTGDIGSTVHTFARTIMENTAIQVILLNGSDLKQILKNPVNVSRLLNNQAEKAMAIKRSQIQDK